MTHERPMTGWKRTVVGALASTGLAVAITLGSSPVTAHADVLDDLANEFTTAQGAGQIPSLLNQSLRLRGAGYNLTNGEMAAVQDAVTRRPNQTPLINALKDAVSGQTQRMKQNQIAQSAGKQGPIGFGINQYDPNSPGGITAGPGGVNIGGGGWQIGGQPGTRVGPAG
jgi:hypothetical protein